MKKTIRLLSFLILVAMCASCFRLPCVGETAYRLGDADRDGNLTASDARLTLRVSAQLETLGEIATVLADVDFSGDITASDARMILRVSADLDRLPTETDDDYPFGGFNDESYLAYYEEHFAASTTKAITTTQSTVLTTAVKPEPTTSSDSATLPYAETVYITPTGSKFHRAGCRAIKNESTPVSRNQAIADGYEPCKICNP